MKKIFFCLIISIFFSKVIFADVYHTIQNRLNKVNNFHAYFIQKVLSTKGVLIQTGKGEVWLKHPNKFNFFFNYPDKMNIISNGKTLWIYNPIINQVNISNFINNMNPLFFLTGKMKLIKKITVIQKKNNFLLMPKKNSNIIFTKININISKKGIINYIIVFNYNYRSFYYFTLQNNNKKVDENKFIFSIPKNSIIDDQRI